MSTFAPFDTNNLGASESWFSKVLASIAGTNLRYRVMRDTAVITSYSIHYTKLYDKLHDPLVAFTALGGIKNDAQPAIADHGG